MDISIIIPAYNEEIFISGTLQSIKKWMPENFSFEIIVVDHGSTDATAAIAVQEGARVADGKTIRTIAALRNKGADCARGEILFFVDADVSFSQQWSENIGAIVDSIRENNNRICGSHPAIPANSHPIVKNWFNPKSNECAPNYIGACHLILHKELFYKLNKFPENMETAEEFTLCLNAKNQGATIEAFPELFITHQGAPRTVFEFIKSEMWHGRSDWSSLSAIANSSVSIATILFILLHFFWFFSVFQYSIAPAVIAVVLIVLLCTTCSYIKFIRHGFFYVSANIPTFYLYFLGRSFSLVSYLLNKSAKKRQRY